MFNGFCSSSFPVIDVPVDAGDDEVLVTVSIKTLRINVRSVLAVVVLAWAMISGLADGMIGVRVDISTELDIVVVVAAASALEVFMTLSCFGDVRAGV